MSIWTIISLVVIAAAALYFAALVFRMGKLAASIKSNTENILDGKVDDVAALNPLIKEYLESMVYIGEDRKTNTPSAYYFNEQSVCKASGINLRLLDTASGTLVGLGLLGTFLGLTVGIQGFDSSNTDTIQQSIQSLLGGMATAFTTSLLGMGLSLIYTTFLDKPKRNQLDGAIDHLTTKLDDKYYIDDVALSSYRSELANQAREQSQNTFIQQLFENLSAKLQSLLKEQTEKVSELMRDNLSYDKDGEVIPLINIARELHTQSNEQTKALKSFSTDLAMELNNGFDEMLSRQLQAKLIPLMESVDRTTKTVIEHIDSMADAVKSPADNMVNAVVGELKKSLQGVMQDFKSNISENTKNELAQVAHTLSEASSTITSLPADMERISQSFQVVIEDMKRSVADTTKSSADANADVVQQMKEQVLTVSKTLTDSVEEVRTVMRDLTTSSQQGSNAVIEQMNDTVSKVSAQLSNAMSQMGETLTKQVTTMYDDMASKQTDLLALQEDTIGPIRTILAQFKDSVDSMKIANQQVNVTLGQMETVHSHIASSTDKMRDISDNMKSATSEFHKTQADYTASVLSSERAAKESVSNISAMLTKTGEVSGEYLSQFGVLKDDLGKVFAHIQEGLKAYSQSVRETTKQYLTSYSSALTNAVDQLNNTVGEVRDIVEALEDQLSKLRK